MLVDSKVVQCLNPHIGITARGLAHLERFLDDQVLLDDAKRTLLSALIAIFKGIEDVTRLVVPVEIGRELLEFLSKFCVRLSGFEEVQEFFADQVVEGIRHAKFIFDITSGIALLDPDFRWLHGITCQPDIFHGNSFAMS